jgi:hypothetical protein
MSQHKPSLRGHTSGALRRARTVQHLDPQSAQHAADKAQFASRREIEAARKEARRVAECAGFELQPREPKNSPSNFIEALTEAGGKPPKGAKVDAEQEHGFILSATGELMDGDHFEALCVSEYSRRSCYLAPRNDRPNPRPKHTHPLWYDTVTSRPDFHFALKSMFSDGLDPVALFKSYMPWIREDWEAYTRYELLAVAVHLGEGNIHLHPIYATADASGNLLHDKLCGRGRRGAHHLYPCDVGILRLAREGFVPKSSAAYAERALKRKTKAHGGKEPLDWHFARSWDSFLFTVSQRPRYRRFFREGRRHYVTARRAEHGLEPMARLAQAEADLQAANEDRVAKSDEIARLREQIRERDRELAQKTAKFADLEARLAAVTHGPAPAPGGLPKSRRATPTADAGLATPTAKEVERARAAKLAERAKQMGFSFDG